MLWLLAMSAGCGSGDEVPLLDTNDVPLDLSRYQLVARFAHITDAQIVDEESPGRMAAVAAFNASAWRPHERYSIHLLDGTIRAINAYHQQVGSIDFVIHTGDAIDNVQANELHWFLDTFDGEVIDPRSGPDDRSEAEHGPAEMDAHRPFRAEGLYRNGVHGEKSSIPWYSVMGNHDRYAVGVFPIMTRIDGGLSAPLPVGFRIGLFLPTVLVPDGSIAYGPITPANPGPPPQILFPSVVTPNPERRFVPAGEILQAHFETVTEPAGHGFVDADTSWYSVSPLPGLRLIVLDSSIPVAVVPTGFYDAGGIVAAQSRFLSEQLDLAEAAGEVILVACHHPSFNLLPTMGTALYPDELREILNAHPNVVAHLVGHTHQHRVWDRGGYIEFETSAIIDFPQEGRIIEIWRAGNEVELRYTLFSHLYEGSAFEGVNVPEKENDPFLEMRRQARVMAKEHAEKNLLLPIYIHADDLLPPLPDLSDLINLDLDLDLPLGEGFRKIHVDRQTGVFRKTLPERRSAD